MMKIENNINQILPTEIFSSIFQKLNETDQKAGKLVCHFWNEILLANARSEEVSLVSNFQACLISCYSSDPNLSKRFNDSINLELEQTRNAKDLPTIRACSSRVRNEALAILKTCSAENILQLLTQDVNIPPFFRNGLPLQQIFDFKEAKELLPSLEKNSRLLVIARSFIQNNHLKEAEEALESIGSQSYEGDEIYAEILLHQKISKEDLRIKLRSLPGVTNHNISAILAKKDCHDELAIEAAMAQHSLQERKVSLGNICLIRAEHGIHRGRALAYYVPDKEIREFALSLLEDL